MKFTPKPPNTFQEFIETYFNLCRERCPKLKVIAGKWTFEDLIPGLSDFDTRFIFDDNISVEEWNRISIAVGEVHTELAVERPEWARILEHLPGINLMYSELIDPTFYYPEFQQWSFYLGDEKMIESIKEYLAGREWSKRDEYFHIKKFSVYYGRYIRGIDPPVNLGPWENKYPLHSRFMHYFTPPIQSAISIIKRRGIAGKFESLRQAREIFGKPEVIDMILDAVDKHYQIPEYYEEPKLTEIEDILEEYLRSVYRVLVDYVKIVSLSPEDGPEDLRRKINELKVDPVGEFFDGARFCRLMKGRLLFYSKEIDWFDSTWLIRNELGRMVRNFYERPLRSFAKVYFGEDILPEQVLSKLENEAILTKDICDDVRKFVELVDSPIEEGQERIRARQVAELYDSILYMIESLTEILRRSQDEYGKT